MDTYKGEINEFIDWVTGNDSFTNRNVSGGLPISGASIRNLLQAKLKTPIVVHEDTTAGLFRMFSSEVARDRWISLNNPQDPSYDPELAKELKLEIFNFDRPSAFVLSTNLSSDPRYIIKGDDASSAAQVAFTVSLKDKEGQTKSDSIVVTYTITNNVTGMSTSFSEPYGSSYVNNPDNPIVTNLYSHLVDGINSVNVNIKANTVSNSIDVGFSIYLISFSLSSSFDFNIAKVAGTDIEIPFEINRSSVVAGSTLKVEAYIDGTLAKLASNQADAVWTSADTSSRINSNIKVRNNYQASDLDNPHVVHTLRLEATMVSGNTIFYSNVLYYTFEIASEERDIVNQFVNIGTTIAYNRMVIDDGVFVLQGTQYAPITFSWSYYTDQIQNQQAVPITWAIKKVVDDVSNYTTITTETGTKNKVNTFKYIPESSILETDDAYLVALYGSDEIGVWPITIEKSSLTLSEATGYNLKLSAYGKSNSSPIRNQWRDDTNNVDVTFSNGVTFDSTAGWDDNSFIAIGSEAYAMVNYVPFPSNFGSSGRTIEVDFQSEQVNDEDDILIDIGTSNAGRITITPTKATVWLKNVEIVSTHYKANERIKLCFIFNKTENGQDGNLVYIVNNGILERAAGIGTTGNYPSSSGIFKIGGSPSGIRVYMIRAYPIAINYTEAYNNFVYDSSDKTTIINRNNIVSGGAIIYEECAKKIDTILIEGDLTDLLDKDATKKNSESTANITRHCVSDPTKDFVIINGKLRKHGQSTLNYPIASMKMWFNKSSDDAITPTVTLSSVQTAMGLNKSRYVMKDKAIPANKFVLQANYADSSGANNGSLERLIHSTWYKAQIDGEYKLRTAPQLFSTGTTINHNDENLNEVGDNAWVEGYGTDSAAGKLWTDIASKPFPYEIRTAPDSFPCAVFYRNTTGQDSSIHFLGQYVFMDDKKSDHVYGERSIYHYYDETDPFCLKTENKNEDKSANRAWNNNKVVRIEIVLLDTALTSYMSFNVPSTANDSVNHGASVPCDTIKYDENGNKLNFYWEDYFEMIYPDPDDFTVKVNGVKVPEDKFANNSGFREKAGYFMDFMRWITGIGQLNSGSPVGTVNTAALNEFKSTASQHLDLWKMAAYYIFFLRFGLVDSVERNAQLKTYDGQHWHYEPWDMDIAVGDKNNGGFTFVPPMNRNTTLPTDASIYAYSGRTVSTSNVLWDCLESWDYWMQTVVPKVAQALYGAGLTYDNIVKMFDDEYSNKWSEVMYNESGHFKYVEMRGNDNDWLAWLQGARISHRHWWLSTSMNYYDAMWTVGDFNNHRIYMAVTKEIHSAGTDIITIKPTSSTFFKLTQGDGNTSLGTVPAAKDSPAEYDVSQYAFNKKDPTHLYGATFIEELDLSCFAQKLETLTLTGAYDSVLGAPIKVLNIGIPTTDAGGYYTGYVSGTRLTVSATSGSEDALANIKVLNVTGQQSITNTESLIYNNNRRTLVDFYAMGTGLTSFTSSRSGNKFGTLQLPAATIKTNTSNNTSTQTSSLGSLTFMDSSWEDISFWTTYTTDEVVIEEAAEGENDQPIIRANPATFRDTGIPTSITYIEMTGSTASNRCAAELVMGWIEAIEAEVAMNNPNLSEEELKARILETLHDYKLDAENISWGTDAVPIGIYYSDLEKLAALNEGNNQNAHLKGYIKIADTEELTSVQVTQIRNWFGESVFNKSNINSGLIIDQELDTAYVQINIGRDAYIGPDDNNNEAIFLNEGHSAALNATRFLLADDDTPYEWSLSSEITGISARLVEGANGIWYLEAREGTKGDYKVTVTARYGLISKSVDVNIIGVTYPTDWVFNAHRLDSNFPVREFNPSASIMQNIFGAARTYQNESNNLLRKCYVMYDAEQSFEFYIEPVNNEGTTATLKNVSYSVTSVDTVGTLDWTNMEELTGDGNTNQLIDDQYLYYTNSASQSPINGIVLTTGNALPTTIKRYILSARVEIGGMTKVRYMNLIVLSDNSPVIRCNLSDQLYSVLQNKMGGDMTNHIYKTDLLGIDGTLSFANSAISNFVTERVDGEKMSIFRYTPYITALDFSGCTNIIAVDSGITLSDKRVMDFSNMSGLETVNMTNTSFGYNSVEESIIDFTANTNLNTLITTGCNAGVKIEDGSLIETLTLGSPTYLWIRGTLRLSSISMESQTNLTELYIENVNKSNPIGFTTFNTLISTV